MPVKSIPAGGSADLELEISIPKRNVTNTFEGYLSFFDVDDMHNPRIDLRLEIDIEGNLAIPGGTREFTIGRQLLVERIPFVLSAPASFRNLEVILPEQFRDCRATIQTEGDSGWIEFEVSPAVLETGDLRGTVTLRERATGAEAQCELVLVRLPPWRVSPCLLRFSRVGPDDDRWQANAIVQFHPEALPQDQASPAAPANNSVSGAATLVAAPPPVPSELGCWAGEERLELESIRLSDQVYRVRVFLPPDARPARTRSVRWVASVGGLPLKLDIPCHFEGDYRR